MDITIIAGSVVSFLVKTLIQTGKTFVSKAEFSTSVGQLVGEKAATLFNKLFDKTKTKQAADEAVQDVIADPKNEDAQAALRNQLQKLMKDDQPFVEELTRLLEAVKPEAERAGITVIVTGSGAAATSGSVAAGKGGIAIMGNVEGGIQMPKTTDED